MRSLRNRTYRCFPIAVLIAVTVMLPQGIAAVAQGQIPVLNAGFEEPETDRAGMPLGWGTYPGKPEGDRMAFTWDDTVAHSGTRSVSLTICDRNISWLPSEISTYASSLQDKDLAGLRPSAVVGHEYTLSVWAKGEGSGLQSTALVLRWTKAGGWVPKYTREYIPLDGDDWQLISISATAPEGSENICPILQVGGNSAPGRVWFDDVRIVDRTGLKCDVVTEPELVELPGRWRVGLSVSGESETAHPLSVLVETDEAGAEPQSLNVSATAEGAKLDVSYRAAGAHRLRYTVTAPDDASAVYFRDTIDVPSALQAGYTSPRYRNTIFGDPAGKQVRVHVRLALSDALLPKLQLAASLMKDGAPILAQQVRDLSAQQSIVFDLPADASGDYTVSLSLTAGQTEVAAVALPLHCNADLQPLAAIGDRNELLIDGKPTFPVGFYSTLPEDFKAFRQDGFNTVLTYSTDLESLAKMGEDAQKAGLSLIVSALRPAVDEKDEEHIQKAVQRFDGLSGIVGYYLCDEPTPAQENQTPEDMRWLYETAAKHDPSRLTCTVFCRPSEFALYKDTCDVYLVDPYPTHYKSEADLTTVADWVDQARAAVDDEKPVWLVPQAFDHLLGPGTYRMPTIEEQRCMCYLGMTHGAKGILWFVYTGFCVHSEELAQKTGKPYAWVLRGTIPACFPLRWEGIKKIVAEVNELSPVLLSEDPEQTQEIVQGASEIHSLLKSYDGKQYLFTVNAKDRPVSGRISVPGAAGKAEVLWEQRQIDIEGGVIADEFKPYEVHVYRFD